MTDGQLTITPKSIEDPDDPKNPADYLEVTGPEDKVYDGTTNKQPVTVKDTETGQTLVEGTDFTLTYGDDVTNVGTVPVTVTGIGNYTGTFELSYEITPATYTVTTGSAEKVYDGTPLTKGEASITGLVNGETATVTATGTITNVGTTDNTYSLTWDGTAKESNYTHGTDTIGKLTVTQKSIEDPDDPDKPNTNDFTVTGPDDTKYNGKEQKQPVTVTDKTTGKALVEGTDCTITYSDDVTNAGEVTVTVTGIGNYTGSFELTYNITPRDVTLTSADGEKVYDATPLVKNAQTDVTVSGDGFVEGEGATYDITGTQTLVGSSDNTFTYTLNDGTLAGNYNIKVVPGTLTVTEPTTPPDGTVTKSHAADQKAYQVGDIIEWTITAVNIYAKEMTITLVEQLEGVTLDKSVFENVAPGEMIETLAHYTVTEDDIAVGEAIENTVDVQYDGGITIPDPDPEGAELTHLTVVKEVTSEPANGKSYALGESIEYKITVTNDGTVEVTDVTVTDELTGDEWTVGTMAAGDSKEFTAKYVVTEDDIVSGEGVVNTAVAEGTDPDGDPIEGEDTTDPEPVDPKNAHLTVAKTTTSAEEFYVLGDQISYKITVTNDGNVTISDVAVTDDLTGDEWTIDSLAPGASKEFEVTYTVTEADVEAGSVVNTATAKGSDPEGEDPTVVPGTKTDTVKKLFTITFDPNGGTLMGSTELYKIAVPDGTTITIIEAPTRDGYTFTYWKGSEYQPGDQYTVHEDHTFVAQWEAVAQPVAQAKTI